MCTSNCSYIVSDSFNNRLVKFDQKWNKVSVSYAYFLIPQALLSVDYNKNKTVYLVYYNAICALDSDLNVLKTYRFTDYYQDYGRMNGLYYNNQTDHLLVTSETTYGFFIFTLDLEFMNFYSFTNSTTTAITGNNGLLCVATSDGSIWVLKNETLSYTFQTLCTSIKRLKIDNGYILVLCSTNYVYFYAIDAVYISAQDVIFTWKSPITSTVDFGFDATGNLVVVGSNQLFLYH